VLFNFEFRSVQFKFAFKLHFTSTSNRETKWG